MENKYFANNLKHTASNLISGTKKDRPGGITGQLEQEIENTLEQLRKLEKQEPYKTISNSFLQPERSVNTGFMQTNRYTPQYVNPLAYSYNQQFSYKETQQKSCLMGVKQKIGPVVLKDRIQRLKQKLFSLMEEHKKLFIPKTRKYWTGIMTEPASGLLM